MDNYSLLLLMTLFIVKHFIADFPLQTMPMVLNKGTYGDVRGIDHSLVHAMMTLPIAFVFLMPSEMTLTYAVLLAALDGLVHYHVDWAKMNINKHFKYTPQDNQFWVWLGIDQLLHYLTYVAICALIVESWH